MAAQAALGSEQHGRTQKRVQRQERESHTLAEWPWAQGGNAAPGCIPLETTGPDKLSARDQQACWS